MRVIIQETVGGPEVLRVHEGPKPAIGPGDVLVRSHHAGINPVDVAVRAGRFPLLGAPPFTVGWDISGVVEAVGEGVTRFKAGDAVLGMPRFPKSAAAYAEYVSAPANEVVAKPAKLGFAEAAGLPLAGLTAWQALIGAANLQPGQKALIHAAAGGVGHLAAQIAKAKGATVVATASAGKLDYVRSLGVDEAIDYARQDFTTLSADFDVVLDPLGGAHAERSLSVLRKGGHVLCLLDPSATSKEQAASEGKFVHRIGVRPDAAGLEELIGLFEAGRLAVHVARAFPLDQAGEAQEFLGTRPIGKVVLAIG